MDLSQIAFLALAMASFIEEFRGSIASDDLG
jgi:hypothetical protein